jgi:hypothetical protein
LGAASLAAILIVVAIVGAASFLVMGNGLGASQTSTTSSTSVTSSTSYATSTSTGVSTSTSATSASGLELSLALNGTSIASGKGITVTVAEVNTLKTTDNLSVANDWPVGGLTIGACGRLNDPMGIEVLSGYYDAANATSGKALQIYNPGIYMCPAMLSTIEGYLFQPSSDNATVYGSCESSACFNETVSATISVTGYWTGGPSTFTSFPSGVYTVVAGDEWGGIAILHFTVAARGA